MFYGLVLASPESRGDQMWGDWGIGNPTSRKVWDSKTELEP